MKYNIPLTLLTLFFVTSSYAQPAYHRIWGVKENRKMASGWIHDLSIKDNVVYFKDNVAPNKIFALHLPEAITETFIEIGTPETTEIGDKHQSSNGSWYIAGNTTETEGFTTPGAYRTEFDDEQNPTPVPQNGFLAKYSATGELQWCTYIDWFASEGEDYIATDAEENIYFVSYKSNDEVIDNAPFQATANPEDFLPGTNKTPTLTKLDSSGAYQWSTFFGMHYTGVESLATTADGIVIGGFATSTEISSGIPVTDFNYFSTVGAYQENPNINSNGGFQPSRFVNKFDFNGERLWGTYYDRGVEEVLTHDNDIYVVQSYGVSSQSENVATEGAFIDEPTANIGSVTLLGRLSSDGSELLWRTYLYNEIFYPIGYRNVSINSDGNIWLFGQT